MSRLRCPSGHDRGARVMPYRARKPDHALRPRGRRVQHCLACLRELVRVKRAVGAYR